MRAEDFTPYAIRKRGDGLVDILFPRDGAGGGCPCHDRLTVKPRAGLEEDLRENYYAWKAKAKAQSEDRCQACCLWDEAQTEEGKEG